MQRAQLGIDLRDVFENGDGVFDGGRQQVGDGKALVLHLQRFAVVAAAVADVAGDVHVRQEVHLDALEPVALAGFAAAALDVEAEAAGLVAALARFGKHGVELADGREEAGVGGGVGARRAADGRLIDLDHFVDVFQAFDGIVLARGVVRSVDFFRQRAIKNVVDERRFAAAGNAGDGDEAAQRKFDGDVFEIVFARAAHDELLSVAAAAAGGRFDADGSGKILAGERSGISFDFARRARGHQMRRPGGRRRVRDR